MGVSPAKEFGEASRAVLSKPVYASPSGPREVATVAGGCFWGIELAYQRVPGVVKTEVGYTQGHQPNPSYEDVCQGTTGHTEAVRITYDSSAIKYEDLLTVLWDIIDPTTLNRQGGDTGTQYRSGIYYHSDEQQQVALRSREQVQKSLGQPIATEVQPAGTWYPAEDYHQQYLQKGGQCGVTGDLSAIRCYG